MGELASLALDLAFLLTFSGAALLAMYGGPTDMTFFGRELRALLDVRNG
jgi:hypothetical protein